MTKTDKNRSYEQRKERVRQEAIEWQKSFREKNYSYSELANAGNYFERLARHYGLVREFKENGII